MRLDEPVEASRRLEARVGALEEWPNRFSWNSSLLSSRDPRSTPLWPGTPSSGRSPRLDDVVELLATLLGSSIQR
jgi:hypothetical protein